MWNRKSKFNWFALFVCCIIILLRFVSTYYPLQVTIYYSKILYPILHSIQYRIIKDFNYPFSYLFIIIFVGYCIVKIVLILRKSIRWNRKLLMLIQFLFGIFIILFASFQLLWGFNYCRQDISEEMKLPSIEIDSINLLNELKLVENKLTKIRFLLDTNQLSIHCTNLDLLNIQNELYISFLANNLGKYHYSNFKILKPKGVLLHWSTSGVYFPFTGECNSDFGLHPIQEPFTIAHEFCHGTGWGDEATCNFLAWLALKDSHNLFYQYSVWFGYWKELLYYLKKNYYISYVSHTKLIPFELLNDSQSIKYEMNKYKDYFPKIQAKVYDQYLKSQGVGEGIRSYNKMIDLVFAFNNK